MTGSVSGVTERVGAAPTGSHPSCSQFSQDFRPGLSCFAPTSPGRAVLADIPYAPYGETYSRTGTYSPEFTGKELDITSPLYDFMFREHNYTEGRWVSPDPAGMAAVDPSNPQTWNRYAYVGGTPLASVDANGTVTLPCGFADVICGDGGGGVGGGWCGDPESDPFGCIPILPPPIPIGGGGGGGSGSGGSGGSGGTGGSGGGTSGGGDSPSPISFPNGENLGLPTGYHFKPLNIFQLLGIEPINPGCDFGLCIPAVEGFRPGLILVGAGTAVCEIAEPCGVIEDIIVAVALLEAARELKQAQDTEWSRFPACSAQYDRDRAVCQQRKTRSCWESAAERLATCDASGGTRLGWPPLL